MMKVEWYDFGRRGVLMPNGSAVKGLGRRLYQTYFNNAALILLLFGVLLIVLDLQPTIDLFGGGDTAVGKFIIKTAEFSREIALALLIAALLIFTTEKRAKDELYQLFSANIEEIKETMHAGVEDIGKIVRISRFLSDINSPSVNNILKRVGEEIYRQYITGLDFNNRGFTLHDIDWVMKSNEIFYRELIKSGTTEREICITHTGSIDVWLDELEPEATLENQKFLIEEKGISIHRIFIGTEPFPLPTNSKYIAAMAKMAKYRIKSDYVSYHNPSQILDMTWLPNERIAMIWRPQASGKIAQIECLSADAIHEELRNDWRFALTRARNPE